jgi:hypothetical protein
VEEDVDNTRNQTGIRLSSRVGIAVGLPLKRKRGLNEGEDDGEKEDRMGNQQDIMVRTGLTRL